MASKKQKKMAELRPLLSARGPTPLKNGAMPRPSDITRAEALASVGRLLAEHIITVFTTSRGVVAAAAAAPAVPPISRSSTTVGCRAKPLHVLGPSSWEWTQALWCKMHTAYFKSGI